MSKLLMYHNTETHEVLVLAANDEDGNQAIRDYGHNLENWPEDLNAEKKGPGLLVWEGNIPLGKDEWVGDIDFVTEEACPSVLEQFK